MPVPKRFIVCGLSAELSINVSVPVCNAKTVGVKVTLTLHLLPTATVVPHVFAEIAKFPVVVMLPMLSVVVPPFFNVTVLAALVSLRGLLQKAKGVGENVTTEGERSRLKTVPL